MEGNLLSGFRENNIKEPLIIKMTISGQDYDLTEFWSLATRSLCLIILLATMAFCSVSKN
jgi:hypothetical protein